MKKAAFYLCVAIAVMALMVMAGDEAEGTTLAEFAAVKTAAAAVFGICFTICKKIGIWKT